MTPEERFLRNQEARQAAIGRSRSSTVSDFWNGLRKQSNGWKRRLEEAQHGNHQRELAVLRDELKEMQKAALAEQELPISDLTLLHKEFGILHLQLNEVRNQIQPLEKFTFRRYRAAWQHKQQQQEAEHGDEASQQADEELVTTSDAPGLLQNYYVSAGNCIQDLRDAKITSDQDGTISVNGKQQDHSSSDTLVLLNLSNCQVTLRAPYQLVHLVNISSDSVIRLGTVDGAIHVTCCTSTSISIASCHQLRLHESSFLKIQFLDDALHLQAGGIMEDCTDIVFYYNTATAQEPSIKDFNWFRTEEPSPNYRMEPSVIVAPLTTQTEPTQRIPSVSVEKDAKEAYGDDDEL